MKKLFASVKLTLTAVIVLLFTSCNNDTKTETTHNDSVSHTTDMSGEMVQNAEATLNGTFADTTVTGTVQFTQQQDGQVKMTFQVTVPAKANGSVAVHIHEHGNCGDTATHAGGHWNPTNTNHGQWGQGSFHSGDIGNITLDAQGRGEKEITSDLWSLGGDAQKNILDKTIIIHSGTDDYKSQPSGNSGTRIGCGIIQRKG